MKSSPTNHKKDTPKSLNGFDHPVIDRDADILNRWPFSQEIYGVAFTGPKDWSVRIGVYGEWGAGKTSVLKFVATMAERGGHIVVWFDPWEHSNKSTLWRSFVLAVFKSLKAKMNDVPGERAARYKDWLERTKGTITSLAKAANKTVGGLLDVGLDFVKEHFKFSQTDLRSLQELLGEKRIIILIDDLDRTAPELIPEILFALKELMDIPGFSFICAFDPTIVGEVLGSYHPGFGNGLKFLDKIIDYPRWLPSPSGESLIKLAIADSTRFCEYVPESAIRSAIPLLPRNPRSVRQFIRLLGLLKPQITRHYDYELRWSAIIASNVLKVQHPRIAHELLNERLFWGDVLAIGFEKEEGGKEQKLNEAIDEHIEKKRAQIGIDLDPQQKVEIHASLRALCSQIDIFAGLNEDSSVYQFNLAENPTAVTWKEFDEFLEQWQKSPKTATVISWIDSQVVKIEQSLARVYNELLNATIRRYADVLNRADNVFAQSDTAVLSAQAWSLLSLLENLVFELESSNELSDQIDDAELTLMVETFASFAASTLPVHVQFWPKNEALVVKLFKQWNAKSLPLIKVLNPYSGFTHHAFDNRAARALHKKLCDEALPKFAGEIIENFRKGGFVRRLIEREKDTFEIRRTLWDADGIIWNDRRNDLFLILSEASTKRAVQENAYELFHWYILARNERSFGDVQSMGNIFSDQAVFDAIWHAAIATPLAPRAVYDLRTIPEIIQHLGVRCDFPSWWQPIVDTFVVKVTLESTATNDTPHKLP